MERLAARFDSIRFRITALAALAVALVLGVAAVALVLLVQDELLSNLDSSLEQRADTYVTSLFDADTDDVSVLLNSNDEDRAVQLTDADGTVLAATPNLADATFVDDLPDGVEQSISSTTVPALEDDDYRVLVRRVELSGDTAILHVAENIDDLDDTVRGLVLALGVAVPAVVVVLVAMVWWLVGRTLRPVDLIRAEADTISGTDLDRRLPVPEQADEISRLAETMNAMLGRIDDAARRQRQFVADASHELRTPVTRIRTEVEVDLDQPGRADPIATITAVRAETIALQNLLDDLLFLARSDEHKHGERRRPTDLDHIVMREVHDIATATDVRIDTSGVAAAHLAANPGEMGRLVRNLLSNAVRHARTVVTVSTTEGDDHVHLTIADDGVGVEASARERIFERFGRADESRARSHGGNGLGLAIVRDIARRHGGDVRYDDTCTSGARFVVRIRSAPHVVDGAQP